MSRPIAAQAGPTRREVGLGAAGVAAIVGSALSIAGSIRNPVTDPTATIMTVYGSLMFTFVGVVVLWRRPGHGLGRLAIVIGLLFTTSTVLRVILELWQPSVGVRVVLFGTTKDVYDVLFAISNLLAVAGLIAGAVLLVAWFPDGRRTSRMGAVVEIALVVGVVALVATSLRDPILRQVGWSRLLDDAFTAAMGVAIASFLGAWILAVVDLALRYRGADAIRRTQMRWVLVASAVSATSALLVMGLGEVIPGIWFFALAGLGLPVLAVAIAITRYHLYDIDRIVSRSISYLVVTALLFVVFGGLTLLLSVATGTVAASGTRIAPPIVAAATLVVAALFNPLRSRVQRIVDRRFHRARYDAERTVAGFAGRLRDELDLPTLTTELRRTTDEAVEPTTTGVWLRTST